MKFMRLALCLFTALQSLLCLSADLERVAITQADAVTRIEQFIEAQHPSFKVLFEDQDDRLECRFCDGRDEDCFCQRSPDNKISLHKILVEKVLFENRHRTYLDFSKLYEDPLSVQQDLDSYDSPYLYFEDLEEDEVPWPQRRYKISSFPLGKDINSPFDVYEYIEQEGGYLFDSVQIDSLLQSAFDKFLVKYADEVDQARQDYQRAFDEKVEADDLKVVTRAVVALPCCGFQMHRSCLRDLYHSVHKSCMGCKGPLTEAVFKSALRAFVPISQRKEKCWVCLGDFAKQSKKKRGIAVVSREPEETQAVVMIKKQRSEPAYPS